MNSKKQAKVVVYSKDYCPYCDAAVALLNKKGVEFELVDVTRDSDRYQEMLHRAAPRKTVPQIFIDDQGIGGFDNLKALDMEGKLNALLFGA